MTGAAGRAVLVMAGGTGGHVYPALAVAEHLRAQGARVGWLGTRRGLEARVVPAAGLPLFTVGVAGLRGKGLATLLAAPLRLAAALAQSLAVLRRWRPDVVLGMGGFVSGPGGLAAWLARRPLVIHEQNALPGLTNRLLAPLARRVLEAFPDSFPQRARAEHTGNPLRAALLGLPAPEARLAGRSGPLRVLVVGGSLGARALNRLVPAAAARLPAGSLEVWQQTGPAHLEEAGAAWAASGREARLEPYLEDMAAAYQWADVAICRAGAMTVAELAAVGVGALLVPYPHAVDDHQSANARHLAAAGAARVLPEAALTPEALAAELQALAGDRGRVQAMAAAARTLAMPAATETVAARCLEAAGG
jgi:UDP-N-acetylglucosamine--N-acetylmuramyl-(pentapeptide) pyrophosphoryl-undecaprenol N-acetylglucosamine transferase